MTDHDPELLDKVARAICAADGKVWWTNAFPAVYKNFAQAALDAVATPEAVGMLIVSIGKTAFDAGNKHEYHHALAALRAGDSTSCGEEACVLDAAMQKEER